MEVCCVCNQNRMKNDIILLQIEKCCLFNGIKKQEINGMLQCLDIKYREFQRGDMVLREGSKVSEIGIVLAGHARSYKTDITGKTIIVSLLEKDSYIGVLLAVSKERISPVSVQAMDQLFVLFIPTESVIKRCDNNCENHERLLINILDGIARKALELHDRNDCLIKSSVREKVLTYLARVEKQKGSNEFDIPLDRNGMAEYLNVERSALSRELSKMKKDRLIHYYKNHFIILS